MKFLVFLPLISAVQILEDVKKTECERPVKKLDEVTVSWDVMAADKPEKVIGHGIEKTVLAKHMSFDGWVDGIVGMCEGDIRKFKQHKNFDTKTNRKLGGLILDQAVIFEVQVLKYNPLEKPKKPVKDEL